jgi:glycosyltransferase involved in cell wall biosynthesis
VSRILYFTRDYTSHDHRFLSALAGTDNQVFYLRLEQGSHQLEDRPLPPQIEQIQWAGGRSPASLRDGPRLLTDLRQVIESFQPDLIHAGPIQRSAFLTALAGFKPLVSMSWGYDLLVDAQRNLLWRWATTYTLKRSAAMVGDCDTIRRKAISYGMAEDRIVAFPWGVDIEHFTPGRTQNSSHDTFTVLSTRGWEPIYGTDIIAQAFAKAARYQPNLRLIMLGHGSQANRIRETFNKAGVSDRVHLPGQISYADLPRYYHMADLYVSASFSDGTSISLLEAMACGCPALVSDIPGNQEWVTPDFNGWWFPSGDADALAETIQYTNERRTKLIEMGYAAREIAELRADWNKNFPNLMKAYQIALDANN